MILKSRVITSLFLLTVTQQVVSFVPAPSNLSISCLNFETIARWSYAGKSQHTSFQLQVHKEIQGQDSKLFYTKDNHFNLSFLITSMVETYLLEVKAFDGSLASNASHLIFSYDKYMPAEVYCMLDFPAVNVTCQDNELYLMFSHPLEWYKHSPVLTNIRNDSFEYKQHSIFNYRVSIEETEVEFQCKAEDNICKAALPICHTKEKYCMNVTGKMKNTVVTNKEVCHHVQKELGMSDTSVLWIVCSLAFVVVFAVIGVMVYKMITKPEASTKSKDLLKVLRIVLPHHDIVLPPDNTPIVPVDLLVSLIPPKHDDDEHDDEAPDTETTQDECSYHYGEEVACEEDSREKETDKRDAPEYQLSVPGAEGLAAHGDTEERQNSDNSHSGYDMPW